MSVKNVSFAKLIQDSKSLEKFKNELLSTLRLSLTGMINVVINYEDPMFVLEFFKNCFKLSQLYRNCHNIDAVELQQGKPGKGIAVQYLDELIYGSVKMSIDGPMPLPILDGRTGERKREEDGFVNRPEIKDGTAVDKMLIINNIDQSTDFCPDEIGVVSNRASGIFYKFRRIDIQKNCKIILVSSEPLKFPFPIPAVSFPGVSDAESLYLVNGMSEVYSTKYQVNIGESQKKAICRKLNGLSLSIASDCLATSFQKSVEVSTGVVNSAKVLKNLRHKINSSFMTKGTGISALEPRPWEDYICPETSSFTHDVKKMMQDFNEIRILKLEHHEKSLKGENTDEIDSLIESIECRIPKVIVLYGKGGTGKSAMPVHLAGLLDFDVWDFNIGASHSKWIGEGARQMRESLEQILKTSHVVIRIDEYDRGMGSTNDVGEGMHEAHKQVESELMNWLQNCQENNLFTKKNIIIVMTTNHKENITGPLLRSGRADLVISIDNFDSKSFIETLKTTARRMFNRGIKAIGYSNPDDLQEKINSMDLEEVGMLMEENGFTVRDVEQLVLEMARHDYYHKKYGEGIPWNKETFTKIVELTSGSIATDGNSTKELELGDRKFINSHKNKEEDSLQEFFSFMNENREFISSSLIEKEL